MEGIRVLAYAKLNLILRVVGRREDGYHLLQTLMCAVDLADELTLSEAERISLSTEGLAVPHEENLALRAARLLAREAGVEGGVHIRLVKKIPPGAGLGGGSSDAAAVLAGLNVTYPMEENRGRFITAWYGVYDPRTRTLRHASAGHPPVIAMGLSDNPKTLGHSGLILGVDPKTQYENEEQTMPPGARLWVYSDGAIEARSPQREEFGIEGLACIMAEANDVPDRVAYVIRKIREFSGQQDFEDDLSLLAVTFV